MKAFNQYITESLLDDEQKIIDAHHIPFKLLQEGDKLYCVNFSAYDDEATPNFTEFTVLRSKCFEDVTGSEDVYLRLIIAKSINGKNNGFTRLFTKKEADKSIYDYDGFHTYFTDKETAINFFNDKIDNAVKPIESQINILNKRIKELQDLKIK